MNAHDKSGAKRIAKLFRNGRSQAVRIPREYEFDGDEVEVERAEDGTLMLRKRLPTAGLKAYLAWRREQPDVADEEFPEISDDDLAPLDEVDL